MQSFKSIYRVAAAAMPILYCGYLIYYFFDVGGSVDGVRDVGLGPTVIGLGAVALLFSIPFLLKVVRLWGGPRSPRSGGGGATSGNDDDDDGGAAADAIIARYMARQAAETAASPSAPAPKMSGPAKPSFGRKR